MYRSNKHLGLLRSRCWEKVEYNKKWDNTKIGLIRCIVKQKFVENNELRLRLLGDRRASILQRVQERNTLWEEYHGQTPRGDPRGISGKNRESESRTARPEATSPAEPQSTTLVSSKKIRKGNTQPEPQAKPTQVEEDTDVAAKEGITSTTSHYLEGMSEAVLKNMLLGLKNTNTGEMIWDCIRGA